MLLVLFSLALCSPAADAPDAKTFEALRARVPLDIEKSDLHKQLGMPKHVSRQVYDNGRWREQWLYETAPGWLLELDCQLGSVPRLHRVVSPIPPRAR